MKYTKIRTKVITAFNRLTKVRTVYPSYRRVAKEADVAVGTAFKTIKLYLKEEKEKQFNERSRN